MRFDLRGSQPSHAKSGPAIARRGIRFWPLADLRSPDLDPSGHAIGLTVLLEALLSAPSAPLARPDKAMVGTADCDDQTTIFPKLDYLQGGAPPTS